MIRKRCTRGAPPSPLGESRAGNRTLSNFAARPPSLSEWPSEATPSPPLSRARPFPPSFKAASQDKKACLTASEYRVRFVYTPPVAHAKSLAERRDSRDKSNYPEAAEQIAGYATNLPRRYSAARVAESSDLGNERFLNRFNPPPTQICLGVTGE